MLTTGSACAAFSAAAIAAVRFKCWRDSVPAQGRVRQLQHGSKRHDVPVRTAFLHVIGLQLLFRQHFRSRLEILQQPLIL